MVKTTTWRRVGQATRFNSVRTSERNWMMLTRWRARLAGPLARRSRSRCSSRSASLRSSRFISRRSFRSSRGGGTRTPSRWFWRPVLCQLSYAPGCGGAHDAREPPGRTGGIVTGPGVGGKPGSLPAGDAPAPVNPVPASGAAPGRRPGPPAVATARPATVDVARQPFGPPGRGADRRHPAPRGGPALGRQPGRGRHQVAAETGQAGRRRGRRAAPAWQRRQLPRCAASTAGHSPGSR